MKELNIIEASKMTNSEFRVIYPTGEERVAHIKTDRNGNLLNCDNTFFESSYYNDIIQAKFIPIQKPVNFMEAVESGKKVKVDYSDIDTDDSHNFSCENYRYLTSLIFDIVNKNGSKAFKEIILNGKWYIED